MEKHYNYVQPILEWAEEKGIFENGRLTKQLMKSAEECLELQTAIESYANGNKGALVDIKDAIGDVYVTLVISTEMAKLGRGTKFIFENMRFTFLQLENLSSKIYILDLKRYDKDVYSALINEFNTYASLKVINYVNYLNNLAGRYGLTLVECIDFAYNTISKRKGKMIDGSFVKEK